MADHNRLPILELLAQTIADEPSSDVPYQNAYIHTISVG